MMMNTVGNYIQRRDQSSLTKRGRQRLLLQCNKILVLIQETKERSEPLEYKVKDSLHSSSNSNNKSHDDERKRNELFHIRVVSKYTKIDTLFDPGCQVNVIYEALIKNMGVETKSHPNPYPLDWVCDKEKPNVTKQCRIIFSIALKLIDEVDLDVVSLDICDIVLGSPYLYDRKTIFFRHENKHHLTKGGVEYIVRAHNMRVNTTLVSAGQMKRLIKSNKRYVLMVVWEKDVETSDAFQGCDPSHKK
jgi:hypothetical protein